MNHQSRWSAVGGVFIALGIIGLFMCIGLSQLITYLASGKDPFSAVFSVFVPIGLAICIVATAGCLIAGGLLVASHKRTITVQQVTLAGETATLSSTSTRPAIITIVSALNFIGSVFSILAAILIIIWPQSFQEHAGLFLGLNAGIGVIGLMAAIGYWRMRRWGVYLYGLLILLGMAGNLVTHSTNIFGYILPLITLVIGIGYLKKMN